MSKKQPIEDQAGIEYQAKIIATSNALNGFYQASMNAVIQLSDEGRPQEDVYLALENISMVWATKIVDDISPKEGKTDD